MDYGEVSDTIKPLCFHTEFGLALRSRTLSPKLKNRNQTSLRKS